MEVQYGFVEGICAMCMEIKTGNFEKEDFFFG